MRRGNLPTPAEYDAVRAFLVLSHAEVEQFFEDCVGLVLQRAARRRAAGKRPRVDLYIPIAYRDRVARDFGRGRSAVDVAVKAHHEEGVKRNHGIALANLARLFGPL